METSCDTSDASDLNDYFGQRELEEECDREAVAYSNGMVLPAKFILGQIVITPGARVALGEEALSALRRHASGDWGDLDSEDWAANERALRDGSRLLSAHLSAAGVKFYVITEHGRFVTTVLLADEY